ncbi:iron-containing alcohol dehydrogenase [Entomobacter blattae]|uniref:Alcohol dehydrogenase 2 n=1 Tax=Entomobacter blattae TaxID=2762277 RepID=A0A7H1NTH6_9PROT|nr:iron-containing alcohol dehydrogenase [Entomobacter blattae]QNT79086.1 Alcohol dehydrogenase 2 [Entomobacter blattae]
MAVTAFFIPSFNLMGEGSLKEAILQIKKTGLHNILLVTDQGMVKTGLPEKIAKQLSAEGIKNHLYDGVQPNPTVNNVNAGLKQVKEHGCDAIISIGGGSSHDCAKGIALVATNGGQISDYEGLDKAAKPQLPLIAVNTTAGTASEMTRFCIITDEKRHVKMAIVDKHTTPIISVNDPETMVGMPPSLTAATGMDALTHCVEAYVSTAATPITDACAVKGIEIIGQYLPRAVKDGKDMEARDQMAYAQFLAGMAFNNASLGYVHAMAHQLGGFYNLPHGVCNAVLLPHVEKFNMLHSKHAKDRLAHVAELLGAKEKSAEGAVQAMKTLAKELGIPNGLKELHVKETDFKVLAENAMKDACAITNPVQPTHAQIVEIFAEAM